MRTKQKDTKLSFFLCFIHLVIFLVTGIFAQENIDPSKISLDVRDADIREVLLNLSAKAKINLLLSPKVQGKLTCRVYDMDARELIEFIARVNGYIVEDTGKVLLILSEYSDGSKIRFEIIPLMNASAEDVEKMITTLKMDKRVKVTHDQRTNRLIVIYYE